MPTNKKPGPARPPSTARVQPLIAVRNVQATSRWYSELLALDSLAAAQPSDHDDAYDRLLAGDRLVLQLHAWDIEEHPNLVNPAAAPPGHGVLLWFEVEEFDDVVERAKAMKAKILLKPHVNHNARHREIWIRDPDGYVVVVASPDGEAA